MFPYMPKNDIAFLSSFFFFQGGSPEHLQIPSCSKNTPVENLLGGVNCDISMEPTSQATPTPQQASKDNPAANKPFQGNLGRKGSSNKTKTPVKKLTPRRNLFTSPSRIIRRADCKSVKNSANTVYFRRLFV